MRANSPSWAGTSLKEVGLAVGREGEDLLHGVDHPAYDDLLCAPGGVKVAEIF